MQQLKANCEKLNMVLGGGGEICLGMIFEHVKQKHPKYSTSCTLRIRSSGVFS
jgi:hypothetical protein